MDNCYTIRCVSIHLWITRCIYFLMKRWQIGCPGWSSIDRCTEKKAPSFLISPNYAIWIDLSIEIWWWISTRRDTVSFLAASIIFPSIHLIFFCFYNYSVIHSFWSSKLQNLLVIMSSCYDVPSSTEWGYWARIYINDFVGAAIVYIGKMWIFLLRYGYIREIWVTSPYGQNTEKDILPFP